MHARIGILSLTDDTFDDAIHIVLTQAYPALRIMPGYCGGTVLSDREDGKALVVTFWETEADMRRSEEEAAALRGDSADALGIGAIPVERYEVDLFEGGPAPG